MQYLQTVKNTEVVVIGGGLAGLTAALDLANRGKEVTVIEKNSYPQHKVCGEYVSNEVRPYLLHLGIDLDRFSPPKISALQISDRSGRFIEIELPLGGFGISRYAFDNHLFKMAEAKGAVFLFDSVVDVGFANGVFVITLASGGKIKSTMAIGAFGKRSNLDVKLDRTFIKGKSPWLGVKGHYTDFEHPSHLVSIHNFPGGYGGLSKTEGNTVNFCYLAHYQSFKKERNLDDFHGNVVSQNPFLAAFLQRAKPKFDKPLSIAQVSFERKKAVTGNMLMCGDAAGLIHPLCGNGMAMAIHSAKLASEHVNRYLEYKSFSRSEMERNYRYAWGKNFKKRLWIGRKLQRLMLHARAFDLAISSLAGSKTILRKIIAQTHGKPILN